MDHQSPGAVGRVAASSDIPPYIFSVKQNAHPRWMGASSRSITRPRIVALATMAFACHVQASV